jgi:hypothetical protein
MADHDESREMERGSDALAASDDFALLATVVFEWHLARTRAVVPASRERATPNVLWMSRNTRRTDVRAEGSRNTRRERRR